MSQANAPRPSLKAVDCGTLRVWSVGPQLQHYRTFWGIRSFEYVIDGAIEPTTSDKADQGCTRFSKGQYILSIILQLHTNYEAFLAIVLAYMAANQCNCTQMKIRRIATCSVTLFNWNSLARCTVQVRQSE